jgi:hypothetical protein
MCATSAAAAPNDYERGRNQQREDNGTNREGDALAEFHVE